MINQLKSFLKDQLATVLLAWQKHHRQVAKKPSEVHLSITDDCCLRCKMCNIWQLKEKEKQPPLDLEQAKKIIDRLSDWLGHFNLTFAGGEPFFNQDFINIIKYAKTKNIVTSTNSNAFIITPVLAKKIAQSGLDKIFFSLDGLSTEHDYVRGKKNSYQRVLNAIAYLQTEEKRPQIYLNTVISQNNLHQLKSLLKLAKKQQVAGINFQVLMPNFASPYQANWFENNPLWPKNKTQIKKNIQELKSLKKSYGSFILNSTSDIEHFGQFLLDPQQYQDHQACFVGLNNIMVDTSGKIRLCYEMPAIANIFKDRAEDFWQGKKAIQVREKIAHCQRPCKLLPCNNIYILHWLSGLFKKNDI